MKPGSDNAALVTRLPAISRGKPPSSILVSHSEYVVRQRKNLYLFKSKFAFSIRVHNMRHIMQVPITAVHGKRYILLDNDDDDDDEL